MSRGREANYAYCVTGFPRAADIREGSRPAPELERARKLAREHGGLGLTEGPVPGEEQVPLRDPVAVLAEVMQRDGAVLSATETLRRELANADHLGVLGAIWYDLTRRAQVLRFERALRDAPPGGEVDAVLSDAARTWLWRSLRDAEAAGLDGSKVLHLAVAARPLTDARDPARVIDARVRRMIEHAVPRVPRSWAERVPEMGDPELNQFMAELAAAMDERVRRIGQHLVATRPAWVTQALGDVPADPVKRAAWQGRAAALGAYRELYGYDAADDAIGPEPGRTSPEARGDWHIAFAALGKVEGIDLRGCTDAQLLLRRAMYERETSWAPRHVGEELRLARLQARTAWENSVLAARRAETAANPGDADRQRAMAGMWQAMHDKATQVTEMLAEAQETRRQWAALTEPTRRAAIAADLELRRRHPGLRLAALRSAEPELATVNGPETSVRSQPVWVQGTLDGTDHLADAAAEVAVDTAPAEPAVQTPGLGWAAGLGAQARGSVTANPGTLAPDQGQRSPGPGGDRQAAHHPRVRRGRRRCIPGARLGDAGTSRPRRHPPTTETRPDARQGCPPSERTIRPEAGNPKQADLLDASGEADSRACDRGSAGPRRRATLRVSCQAWPSCSYWITCRKRSCSDRAGCGTSSPAAWESREQKAVRPWHGAGR